MLLSFHCCVMLTVALANFCCICWCATHLVPRRTVVSCLISSYRVQSCSCRMCVLFSLLIGSKEIKDDLWGWELLPVSERKLVGCSCSLDSLFLLFIKLTTGFSKQSVLEVWVLWGLAILQGSFYHSVWDLRREDFSAQLENLLVSLWLLDHRTTFFPSSSLSRWPSLNSTFWYLGLWYQ